MKSKQVNQYHTRYHMKALTQVTHPPVDVGALVAIFALDLQRAKHRAALAVTKSVVATATRRTHRKLCR